MKLLLCAAVATAAGALSPSALASVPMKVYARVDGVEYEPTKNAATRVVIRGVFGLQQATGAFSYAPPAAGYMYYACPAGVEAECREQWAEIEAGIGQKLCMGWGQELGPVGTVRATGTTPQNPDPYEIGMGVAQAYMAGGICPKLLAYTDVSPPVTDAGPVRIPVDANKDGGAGGGGNGATPVGSDGGVKTPDNGSSNDTVTAGCSVSSRKTGGSMLLAGLAAAAFVLGRRRSRGRAKDAR